MTAASITASALGVNRAAIVRAYVRSTLPPDYVDCFRRGVPPEAVAAPKRTRKPSLAKLIAQAEKSGRTVTSITMPDGTTIHFGEPTPSDATNPWLADIAKATKQ
jgi:hypothetical protein